MSNTPLLMPAHWRWRKFAHADWHADTPPAMKASFTIETWFQWTCNGCGETENYPMPSVPKSEVREYLEKRGWQHFPGDLDYCPRCVKNGTAKRRDTSMGLDMPNPAAPRS